MTDTFNLVPTNNLEKHLDNILRAASGEEPQYDLAPNWRTEQYLAAIVAKLSGGALPPITAADDGKVLTANSGVWVAANPSSGGGGSGGGANNIVYVDYTYEEANNTKTWTLTKTAGEILSLLKSGNIVFIQVGEDEYYQLAGVQQLGANSAKFRFPCIDPNPNSQSNLTYPKITYKLQYEANGLTAYPTIVVNTGGGND